MTAVFLKKCLKKVADRHRGKSRKPFKPNPTYMVSCVWSKPEGSSIQGAYLHEEDKLWIVGEFSPIEIVKIWLFHNTDKILWFKKSMVSDNTSISLNSGKQWRRTGVKLEDSLRTIVFTVVGVSGHFSDFSHSYHSLSTSKAKNTPLDAMIKRWFFPKLPDTYFLSTIFSEYCKNNNSNNNTGTGLQ